jgi:hypothetical protein
LTFREVGKEILPGIAAIDAAGHTPGTCALMLSSNGDRGMLLGDIVHSPPELLNVREFRIRADPAAALSSVRKIRDLLVDEGIPCAAAHFPGLRWGRVVRMKEGHEWVELSALLRQASKVPQKRRPNMPLDRLADREAIKELKARYFRHVDAKEWDLLRALFAPDVKFFGVPQPFENGDAFVDWVSGWFADAITDHHGDVPEITFLGAETARAIWPMTDRIEFLSERTPDKRAAAAGASPGVTFVSNERWGPFGFTGAGHYHDEYRLIDGEWKISVWSLTRIRVDRLNEPSAFLAPPSAGLISTRAEAWLHGSAPGEVLAQ